MNALKTNIKEMALKSKVEHEEIIKLEYAEFVHLQNFNARLKFSWRRCCMSWDDCPGMF